MALELKEKDQLHRFIIASMVMTRTKISRLNPALDAATQDIGNEIVLKETQKEVALIELVGVIVTEVRIRSHRKSGHLPDTRNFIVRCTKIVKDVIAILGHALD